MEDLTQALVNLLVVVIGLVATFVGQKGMAFLKKKGVVAQLESKQAYVNIVVNAMEQAFKEADGATKLKNAQTELSQLFRKNGIPFTEDEISLLIESAVKGMNDGIKKEEEK